MRRRIVRPMRGARGEGHGDAEVWLRVLGQAIAAGKTADEAVALADAAGAAFRNRFPAAPTAAQNPEPGTPGLPK